MKSLKLNSIILSLLLSLVFGISSTATAASCKVAAQKKLASFKTRQKNIEVKYMTQSVNRALKRLAADQTDMSLTIEQRKLAKLLAAEISPLLDNKFEDYNFILEVYAGYLQIRFFNKNPLTTTAKQALAKLKEHANIFADYVNPRDMYSALPIKMLQVPGLINFEQMSELRAYARTPKGTINKNETVDGVPDQNLAYFRTHDDAHFTEWQKALDGALRFHDVNLKELFEQTSAYFEKIRFHLAEVSKPSDKVRNVFFFMYFFVSHEKNIDVISSSRWLYHWNNSLYSDYQTQKTEKELLELPLEQLFPENHSRMPIKTLNELALHYGWPYGEITYAEYIAALKLIRELN